MQVSLDKCREGHRKEILLLNTAKIRCILLVGVSLYISWEAHFDAIYGAPALVVESGQASEAHFDAIYGTLALVVDLRTSLGGTFRHYLQYSPSCG